MGFDRDQQRGGERVRRGHRAEVRRVVPPDAYVLAADALLPVPLPHVHALVVPVRAAGVAGDPRGSQSPRGKELVPVLDHLLELEQRLKPRLRGLRRVAGDGQQPSNRVAFCCGRAVEPVDCLALQREREEHALLPRADGARRDGLDDAALVGVRGVVRDVAERDEERGQGHRQ